MIYTEIKGIYSPPPEIVNLIKKSLVLAKNSFSLFLTKTDLTIKLAKSDIIRTEMNKNFRYDSLVFLNEKFVSDLMSIPTISKYMIDLMENKY